MQEEFTRQLSELIRARYSLLYIVTSEETRAMRMLGRLAQEQDKHLYEWSITEGLHRSDGKSASGDNRMREPMGALNAVMQSDTPAVYVFKDFHRHLEAGEIIRQLRDLGHSLRRTRKTIVLLSPVLVLPDELEKQVTVLDMPLPTFEELHDLLAQTIGDPSASRRFRVSLTPQDKAALARAAQGLTFSEAEDAFALAIVRDGVLDADDIEAITAEKRQIVRKSGLLEYYEVGENFDDVGGMKLLKEWLMKRARAFTEEARRYGLPEPRGILLLGVQGCGKSLVAKAVANTWRIPLLRLDMSRIFQGYIGSSEQNMRRALHMAESLAPVVLWVDEIDKAFSGTEGSGATDSGTTARVVGTFLTWLQEKDKPVFVAATANDVSKLPPELLRKGRLDEIFFVDLPRGRERAEIFSIHLRRAGRNPEKFNLTKLAEVSRGFSGAEIEQAIYSALHDSFFENREVTNKDIARAVTETVPLSVTMREPIESLRAWARTRARAVSHYQKSTGAERPNGPL